MDDKKKRLNIIKKILIIIIILAIIVFCIICKSCIKVERNTIFDILFFMLENPAIPIAIIIFVGIMLLLKEIIKRIQKEIDKIDSI